jgi:bifunctional DNase/RNase
MDAIGEYVAKLAHALGDRTSRRVLAEVQEHLRDAATRLVSAGHGEADARAIGDFGPVELIAAEFRRLDDEADVVAFVRREAGMAGLIEVEVAGVHTKVLSDEEAADWAARFGPKPDDDASRRRTILADSPGQHTLYSVVLKEKDGERQLPIFLGRFEATAIALAQQGVETPRPMTHDLLRDFIAAVDDLTVERAVVTRLEDQTFFAEMQGTHHGERLAIDCRPSDAIAVALRLGVPVFVSRDVPPFSQAA